MASTACHTAGFHRDDAKCVPILLARFGMVRDRVERFDNAVIRL